ncbi:hypothetical protein DKAM_0724 [Desulfurococcus amylolyticus 1221n]|uniref:Uncharacterized protein n=1 Tax=Desulfurococcus amylolyticus (strain DSM 18924 / JCM 16383 / VKM B-2413 / 1221n) TaxID=490899 RepID=B8D4L9_DESA1|nr:hypothetical protein [Desulfurococcus amylolyticus]ACL11050.1 hypothetical protein DKAM_0724 [Desulfurococcus amylolyticus 1221n]
MPDNLSTVLMREASADQCPNPLIRDFKEQDLDEVVEIDKECFGELVRYDGGVFESIPGEHDGSIIFYVAACNNGLGFRSYIGLFKLVSSLHPCSPCIPFGLAYGLGVFAGTLHLELRDRVACHPIPVSGEPVLRLFDDPVVF